MNRPNIHLRPNVLCEKFYDSQGRSKRSLKEHEIARRLTYWELLEYSNFCCMRFPYSMHQDDRLTYRQRAQRDAFIQPFMKGLWPEEPNFTIMPAENNIIPFFEIDIQDQEFEDGSRETYVPEKAPDDSLEIEIQDEEDCDTVDEQGQIITAPFNRDILVLAPPGTGKTHTLIERICKIIQSGQAKSPAEEIVVLSFTRSAVAEIIKRILERVQSGAQDDLRYLTIRTFDSFATWMLLKCVDPERLSSQDYEGRIKLFTQVISINTLPEGLEVINKVRWLFVDEIQDLVGPRAEMVLALAKLVKRNGGNVTLSGDPAQAIYDWQVTDSDGMKSAEFLSSMKSLLKPDVLEVQLRQYRRYTSEAMQRLVPLAVSAMGDNGQNPNGNALDKLLNELGHPVILEVLKDEVKSNRKVAILTRNNLEAFQAARWCEMNSIPCELRRGVSGDYWPGWIARLFFSFAQDRMSISMARKRWDFLVRERETSSFDEAIDFLDQQGVIERDVIHVIGLSARIYERVPFRNQSAMEEPHIAVSTIHRSKGMEYDTVFLLEPNADWAGDPGEVRIFYVAATRAREELKVLKRDKTIFRRGQKNFPYMSLDHFHRYENGINKLLLNGLDELDFFSLLSPGKAILTTEVADVIKKRQDTLWSNFAGQRPGEVCFTLSGGEFWLCTHQNESGSICQAAHSVSRDLRKLGRRFRRNKNAVTGLKHVRVTDLATMAFPINDPNAEKYLGTARLALVPVLAGEGSVIMA